MGTHPFPFFTTLWGWKRGGAVSLSSFSSFLLSFSLLSVSGVIVALGQPHISAALSLLASSVGMVPMWLVILKMRSYKWRFVVSASWFFGVQLIQLSWLTTTTYQGSYVYYVYVGLALWLGAEFGLLSLCLRKRALTISTIFGLSALWTLLEWSRLFILCGFAWNPIGLALSGSVVTAQIASVGGVFGLSFIVMLTNLLGVFACCKKTLRSVIFFVGIALVPYLFGIAHLHFHETRCHQIRCEGQPPLHVALIQTALLPDERDCYPGREDRFVHPYRQWYAIVTYLKSYAQHPLDLIVLPECALPFPAHAMLYPYRDMAPFMEQALGDLSPLLASPLAERREGQWYVSNAFWAQAIANRFRAELVMGVDVEDKEEAYNAALHFTPFAVEATGRYDKRVLLPLAEYLPFSFLRPLVAQYGLSNFFTHGKEAKVMGRTLPMSLTICYEECFPHLVRQGRKKGARLLVNVTNDGWYPHSALAEQHYTHGRLRAIENGVPLLRACNTGVTAAVDSMGRTIARFGGSGKDFEQEKGALYLAINPYTYPTLYAAWGDGCMILVAVTSLLGLCAGLVTAPSPKGEGAATSTSNFP